MAMATDRFSSFASGLAARLETEIPDARVDPGEPACLLLTARSGGTIRLDLTPPRLSVRAGDANRYLEGVAGTDDLVDAYRRIRRGHVFEDSIASGDASPYAGEFLERLLAQAAQTCPDNDARRIAAWTTRLDPYCAAKSIESLLNRPEDRILLRIAESRGWTVHFDHLAIRCGVQEKGHAQSVVQMLKEHHGYASARVPGQEFYRFAQGWNALPVYKLLGNGSLLRLFPDQSETGHERQIIRHWNRVYGFTAHHIALRVTGGNGDTTRSVPLSELIAALRDEGIECLAPTGVDTINLLEQVFTRPNRDKAIPKSLLHEIRAVDEQLADVVCNAKLVELVSRREMDVFQRNQFLALYELEPADAGQHHARVSAPIYNFFLPAQAAHVIRTSTQGDAP
ncbi:MAG: hypothetical protein U9R74_05260 [Pseudomonadota bacterium]|nr:hypothetical protein [Pseudomonadota bacterium]